MPEILTESFCERCGTRYTFEAVAPKARPLTKLKVLSKGLRNYVLSDETTLDEAFADARSDRQRDVSSQQLDAFHKAFNFCMSCRQYTCANCWNDVDARCLTCAPRPGDELLRGPIATEPVQPTMPAGPDGNGSHAPEPASPMIGASAWPTIDLRSTSAVAAWEPVAEAAEVGEAGEAPEASTPQQHPSEPGPQDERAAPEEPARRARPTSLFARFRQDRDAERVQDVEAIAAEPIVGAVEPVVAAEPQAEPILVAEPEPEPVAVAEPVAEPVVIVPEPVAAEPEPKPDAAAPEPPIAVAQPAPVDLVEVPVWRIVAPDPSAPPASVTPRPGAAPSRPEWPGPQGGAQGPSPQWPTPSQPAPWTAARASGRESAPPAAFARPPLPAPEALWVASSRDVLDRPGSGVQACVSCALPLSATAAFCRRCGTRQR